MYIEKQNYHKHREINNTTMTTCESEIQLTKTKAQKTTRVKGGHSKKKPPKRQQGQKEATLRKSHLLPFVKNKIHGNTMKGRENGHPRGHEEFDFIT